MSKGEKLKFEKKPIPDGGYGWVILVASFFISFMIDGIMYSFGLVLKEMKDHFGVSEADANLAVSLNTGFLFCSGPIVAGLTSSFGCRNVIMCGAVVTSCLYFFCVVSPSIVPIWIFYGVIGGVSTGCTYISSLIVIAEWFDKKIGIANGVVMAGSGVGSFLIPNAYFGLRYFINSYDWKFALSICASGILLCCGLGAFLTPLNPPQALSSVDKTEKKKIDVQIQTYMGSMYSLKSDRLPFHQRNKFLKMALDILKDMANFSLLRENMGFLLITMSNFCLFTGYFIPFIYLVSIAETSAGMSDPTLLLSLIGALNIPFRILFGWIVDVKILSGINLNTLCIFFSAVPFFLYQNYLQYTIWGQYVFTIAFAIGAAGMNSLTTAYLLDIVGIERFGNATGIVNLFRGIGCFSGPLIAGFILDTQGWEKAMAFYFTSICYFFGFILTLLCSLWCMARGPREEQTVNMDTVGSANEKLPVQNDSTPVNA